MDSLGRHSQLVFDSISDAVSIIDAGTFKIVDANRAFLNQYHLQRNDVIGTTCHLITHHQSSPCTPPLDPCPLYETAKKGTPTTVEHVHLERGGGKVYVEITTFPMFDDSGKVASVVHISRDITERKRAEEERKQLIAELEITQVELKQLFNEVPCYISIQDEEFRLTKTNRKFQEDFGEELGCYCYEKYKHKTARCFPCPVQETFETGQSQSSEEILTTQNGEQLHVLVRTAPILNSKGEIRLVMEMSMDITEIRKLQDRLSSLGLMIGSMSHGVKGLLTGLDGGMYFLDTGFKKNDQNRIKDGIELVKVMISRIRKTILDILYYTKERKMNYEKADVVSFTNDLIRTVEPKVRDHGIELICNYDNHLGNFEIDVEVLRISLINLLENAVEACLEDTSKLHHKVIIDLSRNQDLVTFIIEDNGIGMDAETKNNMFTLFFSSKGSKGTGLGLYISHEIIKQHGGTIAVETAPGKGSIFKVTIPATVAGAAEYLGEESTFPTDDNLQKNQGNSLKPRGKLGGS
ncbi:MAG: PAS domain-containing sensor histidine kinase [Deltaproteobacteria bacterium]|nr:PAS domain-containing sensor histidine kinase [Deltaproteobacteria bacterium]